MRGISGITRLGLIGGTFNPIHLGHLRSAEEVADAFGLERVVFVVSAVPPHKEPQGIIDVDHRLRMVRLALSGNPRFVASDLEVRRAGRSYTVDTLRYFRRRVGNAADIYFIIGMDAFSEITAWREYGELFRLSHFVVTDRPTDKEKDPKPTLPEGLGGVFSAGEGGCLVHAFGTRVYFHDITALDISATAIRGLVKDNRSIRYLVPDRVRRYIEQRGLYR
jgi:nicotinate-nucleotide adenylyltransferase